MEINLANESDRGCVIVAAAILDQKLESIIRETAENNELSNKNMKSLFDMSGPISNFSSKILLSRAFGLIDEKALHDLLIVRKLRNTFAHATEEASFLNSDVVQKIRSMHVVQECMKTTHKEFFVESNNKKESATPTPKDWELRAAGMMPVDKSMFCVAVKMLEFHITICAMAFKARWISGEQMQKEFLKSFDSLSEPNLQERRTE